MSNDLPNPDILEDLLAFLYATGDRKPVNSGVGENICPTCGAVLEYDEDTGKERCPECG